nr:hypothetical protein [uncultured Gellertiella sp.]
MGFAGDPVVVGLSVWGVPGLLVAVAFLLVGFDRVDPAAHHAYAVRPLLVPGIVLLWPLVVWRWVKLERERGRACR